MKRNNNIFRCLLFFKLKQKITIDSDKKAGSVNAGVVY